VISRGCSIRQTARIVLLTSAAVIAADVFGIARSRGDLGI
jgi:hypothetical protein